MKSLPKNYDHKEREKFWQEHWVSEGTYHFRDDLPRERTFVIDTPPPTVSGVLHMGHIFSYTQADFVARYQRMSGKDVFYPMGFDDNGLPTERLVEKIKEKKASQYESREAFIEACKEVVASAEEEFRKLFKSAALSVDWRREYQTVSNDVRKLSQASFIDLLQKNEAYRDFRPTYWDWVDQTAIAQAEIENKEMPGVMNEIRFALVDGDTWNVERDDNHATTLPRTTYHEDITIMTTRPELLGACVAVMYHPEDPNAANYKGKHAITPLFGVKVPMIADAAVEREKGTGLVMCCTFGDDTDKEWWRKYKLPLRALLTKQGKLDFENELYTSSFGLTEGSCAGGDPAIKSQDDAVGLLQGLKPKQAAAKTIELLQASGALLKQTPMVHTVKCAERSGTPIEIIPTHQWFVKLIDKKEALLAKGAECTWYPDYMRIRFDQWTQGLKEDWCISRQRFFGVPFPVWYVFNEIDPQKTRIITPTIEDLPVDPLTTLPKGYTISESGKMHMVEENRAHGRFTGWQCLDPQGNHVFVVPDIDVMDTWATSSISPQINAKSLTPNKLFPADLRPQAHEIIRSWAFYTIAKAHLHANVIPWKNLMISGWCLAADKSKMSKSKGNVITPVALIEEKGSDAVRYWASTSRLGTDTAFSEDLLKIGRKLVTKLWNASNFASLNLAKIEGTPTTAAQDTEKGIIKDALDIWILSRLHQAIKKATHEFEQFEYCDARVAIEDFFWNDFCDNYLELVKARAYGEVSGVRDQVSGKNASDLSPDTCYLTPGQQSSLYTIYHCLNALLRLFAPFVPHIAEELYSHIFDGQGSVHARGTWPNAADYPYDAEAERSGMAAVDVLNVIRKAKSEANVSIKFPVKKVAVRALGNDVMWKHLEPVLADLKAAGNAELIMESTAGELPMTTEKGWFAVDVTLVKIEEQKRNAEQAAHEKLEGKIIHGPGTPDMSKQVVKLQVNSLPETLTRQK